MRELSDDDPNNPHQLSPHHDDPEPEQLGGDTRVLSVHIRPCTDNMIKERARLYATQLLPGGRRSRYPQNVACGRC